MVPEYGQLALIFAFVISICLATIPLVGTLTGRVLWMVSARSLSVGLFVFVGIAYACLTYAFYYDDFSVMYVQAHSNALLPVYYKICAVWGGHEGSLLLWVLMLASWTLAVSTFSARIPVDVRARVLSVMGMISVGFLAFMIFTSNPFDRLLPSVPDIGSDLNPLLQDPGFIFHPPMLYMGYVGFSVVFAFAIAALIGGRLDSAWARWSRPWCNVAWSFLTFGIALGSWWAYYELGWGGWWMWDPVENASFMPWLAGTALIHSLAASEKRGVFKNWTLLLAIMAFSLSLLGTFLVRSGLITSVHAFAADPDRGIFILVFLSLVVGGSLTLFAVRAPNLRSNTHFSFLSREAFLLANSILILITCCFVLIGTLFPMVTDAMGLGKFSVGEPYFDFFFTKFMGLVAFFMGTAITLNWKSTKLSRIRLVQGLSFVISFAFACLLPLFHKGEYSISAAIAIFLGVWVISSSLIDYYRKAKSRTSFGIRPAKLNAGYYGMMFAHLGFATCLLGASLNTIYSDQRELKMSSGSVLEIAPYSYELLDVVRVRKVNYEARVAEIRLSRNGKEVAILTPEKRHYFSGGKPMTESDQDSNFWRDIYVSLGEPINQSEWAIQIYFKPFMAWIWIGALLMGLGGIIAVMDKRYKVARIRDEQLAGMNGSSEQVLN
ncbi:MAG: cytochrome c-type biogenesis protein CcmF [Flavobacteriales bacterium]|jgi:cytochrome c-type biogenesis protein CcmF